MILTVDLAHILIFLLEKHENQKIYRGKAWKSIAQILIEILDSATVEGKIMPPDFQIFILRQVSMCTLHVKSFRY